MFSEVIGQEELKNQLLKSVRENRVSHAQLFVGAEGTGALPVAVAYAQYILCEERQPEDACGKCSSCIKSSRFIHPDLHFSYPTIGAGTKSSELIAQWREAYFQNPYLGLEEWLRHIADENKQGNITALECYDIIKRLSLKTFESRYKVLIMWMPELLGKEGNILLKLLEEPPDNTVILMVAQDTEHILNTIQSRTQLVRINKLSAADIAERLQEKEGLALEEALSIARLSDGNYNQAVKILSQKTTDHIEMFREWMRLVLKNDRSQIIAWVDANASVGRENLKNYFRYALTILRETLMHSNVSGYTMRLQDGEQKIAEYLARQLSFHQISAIYELINKAHYHVERNAQAKILLLDLSIKMVNIILNKKAITTQVDQYKY